VAVVRLIGDVDFTTAAMFRRAVMDQLQRIHQPPVHLTGGAFEHEQDCDRDQETDHRVGPAPGNSQ
jgi:hypothetical protein